MTLRAPATVDLSKYIEKRFFGERPHVRDRRIPVATLAYSARSQNWNNAEIAHNFGLSEAEVLAALLYYEEYKALIDSQEVAYQAELDEAYRRYGMPQ
jgi:uncharacterized protein (DUF433 family)